jgi:hypothetical protein
MGGHGVAKELAALDSRFKRPGTELLLGCDKGTL